MKDKLIAKLKQAILDMKESSSSFVIEMSDTNKNEIISDLVIPFMQLTDSETVTDLHAKLDMLVNGDFESEGHKELLNKIVDVLMDSQEDIDEQVSHIVTNAYGVINKFNELKKESDDKKESSAFEDFNKDILTFMNIPADNLDGKKTKADDDGNEGDEEQDEPDTDTTSDEEEEVPENSIDCLNILDAKDKVSDEIWSDVNQVEQKNFLMDCLEKGKVNAKEAIDEMYGLVLSYDKMGDWK